MTKRKKQKILGFVIGAAMGAALWMNPLVGKAVTKEEKPVEAIEKIMLSASTKKIEYKKGKIKSVVSSRWKNAKRMLRSAKALDIKKKGWYSFLITEGAGTRQTVQIYLQKKKSPESFFQGIKDFADVKFTQELNSLDKKIDKELKTQKGKKKE